MEELVMYQKSDKFCMTRQKIIRELDAEELIRELKDAREQLVELKNNSKEFERDIKVMELFLPIAEKLRDKELKQADKDANRN